MYVVLSETDLMYVLLSEGPLTCIVLSGEALTYVLLSGETLMFALLSGEALLYEVLSEVQVTGVVLSNPYLAFIIIINHNYVPEAVSSDGNGSDELPASEAPQDKTAKVTTRSAKAERKLKRNCGLKYGAAEEKVVKERERKSINECKRHKCHAKLTEEHMDTLFYEYWNQQPADQQPRGHPESSFAVKLAVFCYFSALGQTLKTDWGGLLHDGSD